MPSPANRIVALDRAHLLAVIAKEMEIHGSRCCLNHIDVSHVTDMKGLFAFSDFNGDISTWNTGSVLNMHTMFCESVFNGDISRWDVSRVKNMHAMFAASSFNGDISLWDVSKVKQMAMMFYASSFVQDISGWNVSPKADIDRLCREHAPLLAAQSMTRWVLRLHVAEK